MAKWQPFQLPDGSYSDPTRPWSQQDLVNYLPMQAEMAGSRSSHLLRTAPGLKLIATLGTGPIRGIRDVEGTRFIVSGTTLYRLNADGSYDDLGTIPGTGLVSMTHNQVAGGNQLVVANGSSGYIYDTRDDSLRNPESPDEPGSPEDPPGPLPPGESAITPEGTAASTSAGTDGGFSDDAAFDLALPTVFGTDIVGAAGEFASSSVLDDWEEPGGGPLPSTWSVVDGCLRYHGSDSTAAAIYRPGMLRMGHLPMPRYTATASVEIRTEGGGLGSIGTGGGTSVPAEYETAATVTISTPFVRTSAGITANGTFYIPHTQPACIVNNPEGGTTVTVYFDNFTFEILEEVIPTTAFVPDNIDFPTDDLTGWVTFAGAVTETIAGGELAGDVTSAIGPVRYYVNEDPITLSDAAGKYIRISAEVWSDDPTVQSGVTRHGVALGVAVNDGFGNYTYAPWIGPFQRGDWTEREWWQRVVAVHGLGGTSHAMFAIKGAVGYTQKIRNIVVEVTDDPVD